MHYVYVLKSKKAPQKLYIGFTNDLTRRLIEHNQGKSRYTNLFRPWNIIYHEAYFSKKDATERELQLEKHAKAWGQLKRRIKWSKQEG